MTVNKFGITVAPLDEGGYLCFSIIDGAEVIATVENYKDAIQMHPSDLLVRSHT